MVVNARNRNNYKSEFSHHQDIEYFYTGNTYEKENEYYTKMQNSFVNNMRRNEPYRIKNGAKRKVTYLGVVRMDPVDYVRHYGNDLINSRNLPDFVKNVPTPPGYTLAANSNPTVLDVESQILEAIKNKTVEFRNDYKLNTSKYCEQNEFQNLKLTNAEMDSVLRYLNAQRC